MLRPGLTIVLVLALLCMPGSDRSSAAPQRLVLADELEPRSYLPIVMAGPTRVRADFAASPTCGAPPLTVVFSNTSTGSYSASWWAFGDGATSTLTSPSHTYVAAGSYTVTLTVSGLGGTDALTRSSYVTARAPGQVLQNGSFEEGWTDVYVPPPINLTNQQPNDWTLSWVEIGQPLYDADTLAGGVPECVHKLSEQLPPDEQLGGPNALILDGDVTYKTFHFSQPFGTELKQTVSGLVPGSTGRLTVPIQVHLHGDLDAYAAESGAWVEGYGGWANAGAMGDRDWYEHIVDFVVPGSGQVTVLIRFKSKWALPKDFFIDAVRMEAVRAEY